MYTVARECRIPVFGNRFTLKDTDEEAGKIVHHINPYESLNAPEFGIMANHKNSNELQTEREPGNSDKRVINNFQKETQLRLRTKFISDFLFLISTYFWSSLFFPPILLVQKVQSLWLEHPIDECQLHIGLLKRSIC